MSQSIMTIDEKGNLSIDSVRGALDKITKQHKKISKIETPKGFVKKKLGFDYVELSYMKSIANEQYPGWSWTIIKTETLSDYAYVVHGRLKWLDNGLWREGDMVAAHRIQKKRGSDEYVDIGNDVKSANTDTMKKAFNVYMDIAADVYRSEDPTLSDEQINKIMDLADKTEMTDEISKKITEMSINTANFKGAVAKLERMVKQ
ncbi:MAG: hypothetical protein H8E55_50720 [Pelagibacterales bacterium]|nr:hypothetical protein [Pelagibacterales bacterium]